MKRYLSLALTAVAGLAVVSPLHAAKSDTDATPMASVSKAMKDLTYPFHGKVTAVDMKNSTFTLGGKAPRIIVLTESTKVMKNGQMATLKDAVVGEDSGGRITKTPDGKLTAISVRFGPKPDAAKKIKKGDATAVSRPAAASSSTTKP